MIDFPKSEPAAQLARLLAGDDQIDPDDLDWTLMQNVAEQRRMLLPLADWFARRGETPAPRLAEAFARARAATRTGRGVNR